MMTRFLLANRFPLLLWWGPQFCSLYNEAYRPILGVKHPQAIGQPVSECWSEIWRTLKPLIETPFHGGPSTWMEDIPLAINRYGFLEETHFTIAYSPVPDETAPGGIGGVLATVHEISQKVFGERRTVALRDLGARSIGPKTAEEACALAAETLGRHSVDVPFCLLYLMDPNGTHARLAAVSGVGASGASFPTTVSLKQTDAAWPFSHVAGSGEVETVENIERIFGIPGIRGVPAGPWAEPPHSAAIVPIRSSVPHQLAGFMVAGLSPRLRFDEPYRNFLELAAGQIGASVTSARAYEAERERADALAEIDRAKTEFFSNVSHEFRTPLTLILGPVEEMLSSGREHLPGPVRKHLEMISRNGARLLRLVNTLLDFSRIEAGRADAYYEPVNLAAFTQELAAMFRSAIQDAGLRLLLDCQLSEPVFVDRDMWEKIVLNLVSNAFKFTFDGEIAVTLKAVKGHAELRVHDTGVGIPSAALPHIFERFNRGVNASLGRTHEGSGIGLALVEELVKLHGGSITATSVYRQGSTFIVRVPLGKAHLPPDRIGPRRSDDSAPIGAGPFIEEALSWLPGAHQYATSDDLPELDPVARHSARALPGAARARVLVADDNRDMRQYIARLLGKEFEVETVGDGEAALESIEKNPPDLILSDIMMPNLDGISFLGQLRADWKTRLIPVILLSARAGAESRVEGVAAAADDYMVKPFDARELMARVRTHLKLARIRRDADQLIRDTAERLDITLAATDTGTFRWNPRTGEFLEFGDNLKRLFGKGPDARFNTTEDFLKLVHPIDAKAVRRKVEACLGGADLDTDCRVVRDDGDVRWLHARGKMEHDEYGRPTYLVGACTDITVRKQAENLTAEQKRLLELVATGRPLEKCLLELTAAVTRLQPNARAAVLMADPERKQMARAYASDFPASFSEGMSGAPINELPVGTCGTAIFEGRPIGCSDIANAGEWSQAWRKICLEHGVRAGHSTPVFGADGKPVASFFICFSEPHEATLEDWEFGQFGAHIAGIAIARARARDALRDREERYRAVFEQTTGGVAEKDLSGRFTLVNDRFCELVGRTRAELLKLRWQDITHPSDAAATLPLFEALAAGRGPNFVIEKRYLRPGGQPVWVRSQISGVRDVAGEVVKIIAAVTDISDLKTKETELRAAESSLKGARDALELRVTERTAALAKAQRNLRRASASLLTAQDEERRRIARDLHDSAGQLLAALGMNLGAIEQKAKEVDPVISAAAAEGQSLVHEVSREIRATAYLLHPPLLHEHGLSEALRQYVEGVSERTGIAIELIAPGDFGRLPNETELAIFRVIQEALTNIHRHSGSSRAWIRLRREDGRVCAEVEDEGHGIPAGKLNGEKSGVGLAGMRERVEFLGGGLLIESSSAGTKVSAVLPASDPFAGGLGTD